MRARISQHIRPPHRRNSDREACAGEEDTTRNGPHDMAFNPLEEQGLPLEDQFRNWNDLNVEPYDKDKVDPYTRTRDPHERRRGRIDHLLAPVRATPTTPRSETRSPVTPDRTAAAEGRQRPEPRRPDAARNDDRLRAGRRRPDVVVGPSRAGSDAQASWTSRCSKTSTTSTGTRTSTT